PLFISSSAVVTTDTMTVNCSATSDTNTRTIPSFPTRRSSDLYQWVATYSGDSNNNGATSALGDEPETVIPASPTINTIPGGTVVDRKSTRLNSSHSQTSYAVLCLKKNFTLFNSSNAAVYTDTV